jgi:Fibronectin type III domain
MNYSPRLSLRLARWMSLVVCGALVLTPLSSTPITEASKSGRAHTRAAKIPNGGQGDRNAQKVKPDPPQPGPPFPNLPNLNEIRTRQPEIPHAPLPIPSTLRSRRKPAHGGNSSALQIPPPALIRPSDVERERFSVVRASNNSNVGNRNSHHGHVNPPLSTATSSSSLAAAPPDAPTSLIVTSTSATHIQLSWTASSGAVDHYQVERSTSLAGPFAPLPNAASNNLDDTNVASLHSYLYRVRAINTQGGQSGPSNMVFGTAITFLDEQLIAGQTVIQAQHLYDLRNSVNAVRALVPGLNAATWHTNDVYHQLIYGNDVLEVRNQLNDALGALGVPISPFEDPVLVSQQTLVKKIHFDQLRERSRSGVLGSSSQAHDESSLARLSLFNQTGNQLRARFANGARRCFPCWAAQDWTSASVCLIPRWSGRPPPRICISMKTMVHRARVFGWAFPPSRTCSSIPRPASMRACSSHRQVKRSNCVKWEVRMSMKPPTLLIFN